MRKVCGEFRAARIAGAFLLLGALLALPVHAGVVVNGPFEDATTQGNWPGVYGECFFLIPDTKQVAEEIPIGPDFFSGNHEEYRYDNCYGGPFFDNDPAESQVDWRIFINNPSTPGNDPALAYVFGGPHPTAPDGEQWNPCVNAFRGATWDNDAPPPGLPYEFDPITVEVVLDADGEIELAYYFLDADNVCRDAALQLFVNGVLKGSGEVENFRDGKYVVFVVSGLVGVNTIRLDVTDAPGDPNCVPPAEFAGRNSHVSGVFIGGPACEGTQQPFCGDGHLDSGEECDDGNNANGDGCSANCEIEEEQGGEGCTPGFWKNHLTQWQAYTPNQTYASVFGVSPSFGSLTLQQVVGLGGGGQNALGRHAVSALLNAAHSGVDYDFSTAGVIALVQAAYANGTIDNAHTILAGENEQDCPLAGGNTTGNGNSHVVDPRLTRTSGTGTTAPVSATIKK